MINKTLWILSNRKEDLHLLDSIIPDNYFQSIRYLMLQDIAELSPDFSPSVMLLLISEKPAGDFSPLKYLSKEDNSPPVVVVSPRISPEVMQLLGPIKIHAWFTQDPSREELEGSLSGALKLAAAAAGEAPSDSPENKTQSFIRYFHALPAATLLLNRELEFVEVNHILAEINGLSAERHRGKKLRDLMPETADQLETAQSQLYNGDRHSLNFQVSIHKPESPEKFRHLFATFFLLNKNINESYIGGYLFNLHDYNILFNKMKTYKEEYGHLFEKAPIGILLMDTSGNIRELNIEMARILGGTNPLSVKSSTGKFHKILNLEKRNWKEFIYLLQEKGHVENFEISGWNTRGEEVWLSISAQVNVDAYGKSPLINAFVSNITGRIKAEQEALIVRSQIELVNELNDDLTARSHISEIIRKTCDRLTDIYHLRFADLYLHRTDNKGNEYIVYQYSNIDNRLLTAAEKLTGLSLKEIKIPLFEGSSFMDIYHRGVPLEANGHDRIAEIIKDYVDPSRKSLRNFAGQVSRLAGNKYVYLVPIITHGHTIGHIGFNRDLPFTDNEKQAVQTVVDKLSSVFERDQNEKRTRYSLQEKETLLKEIHHRVKNNMQIISSLLALQSFTVKDKTAKEHLMESQNRIRSMAMIHEQLYKSGNLSKIDFREHLSLLAEEIMTAYSVNSTSIDFKIEMEEVFLEIECAIPCSLIANELISNSLKHAFTNMQQGTITVSFEKGNNSSGKLTVSDSGIGINEEQLLHSKGSLGIQLITDLTKQLNGTLHVNNNGGTSISVEFNMSGEKQRSTNSANHIEKSEDSTSILIVEDDIITASFLRNQLEKEGYYIPAIISTGEEAVAYCDIAPPDIIIMDILLAGEMDGIEAARRIKSHHEVALLYASGNSEDFSLVKAQKTSPVGFIVKPINIQDVLRLIKGVMK